MYITGFYSKKQTAVMNHYKDQPNNGPTIYAFENPETKATRTAFVNSDNYDDITDFTWRFGYNNGHPCIFITFSAIHPNLKQNGIICLETNTLTGGKNRTINVYGGDYNNSLNLDTEGYTWIWCSEIIIGEEICLYISGKKDYTKTSLGDIITHRIFGPWRFALLKWKRTMGNIPNDWKIKLNIRPTFRVDGLFSTSYACNYTSYNALSEYKEVEYFMNDEIVL